MGEKSKLFLVLCLHRSGSSATAGVMHHLGIHMGDKLLPATQNNQKGHYESVEFVKLNQEILLSANGNWNRPPSREKIANVNFPATKIRSFIAKQMRPVWGLKDPRALLTFEVWKPYLEEVADITYVFVHRPFQASVRSLAHRDRVGVGFAGQILTPYLINLYNYRHNGNLAQENMMDVYYQDIIKNPEPFVKAFNEKIGNPPDYQLDKVRDFLDMSLKNF